jgi:peptide/nickel transport system permease protein
MSAALTKAPRSVGARLAGLCLGLVVLLAVAAPLVASGEPLLCWGQGLSSPWLSGLFHARVHESALDRVYNLLLLAALPLWGLRRRPRARVVGAAVVVALGVWVVSSPLTGVRDGPVTGVRVDAPDHTRCLSTPIAASPHAVDLSSVRASPSARHWLGTDAAGRDVAARLVWGARPSLTVGVLAVALYLAFGALLGALAGYYGGWVDLVIQRLIEVVMTMPALFLVLAAAAFIEQRSFVHVLLIIAAVGWTTPARLVRAELLRLRGLDFVLAARASGYPERTILWREILPNAVGPLLVSATLGVGSAILTESTLSFLGLGDPTLPSWGQILSAGSATGAWPLILAPGLAIFATVLSLHVLGESLREAYDPRSRP